MDATPPPESPATPASTNHPTSAGVLAPLTAAFGWLMCTLATGAVAAFGSLVLGFHPSWLILILALPLTVVLRVCGCIYARWAGPVAAAAVLLAGFYAASLVAIARIAAVTSFPYGQAFWTGGPGLTLQVAMLNLSALSVLIYAAAAAIAAALATRIARPAD